MGTLASHLDRALRQAGVPIESVSIGQETAKATWRTQPEATQAQAQPVIDSFSPGDPAHLQADLEAEVVTAVDAERLISAVVWTVIDTYSGPATIAKYQAARTKIIAAYKSQPWKP